jgi:hypothetical protein
VKQEISILINGKEPRNSEYESNEQSNLPQTEIAAAIEEVNNKGYTLLAAPIKKNDFFSKRKKINVMFPKRTSLLTPNKRKPLPKQIVAAIMGAVVTGTVLGLLVLMVFSTDITEAGSQKVETPATVQKEQPVASEHKFVKLPPIKLDFSALQAGVFSSEERAEDVLKSIEENGFSGIILNSDEKFAVIVGMANEKHQLDRYNESYQKKMDKPHAKTLSYSFENLKTPNSLDETYFTNGKILLQNVLTLSQMPGTKASDLDQTLTDFNKWKAYGKNQKKTWKEDTAKAASDFEKQLEGTFLALKDIKKDELNWAFQQKAMDSLNAYISLLSTLK